VMGSVGFHDFGDRCSEEEASVAAGIEKVWRTANGRYGGCGGRVSAAGRCGVSVANACVLEYQGVEFTEDVNV
jgi:hypothetical protein